jgi:LCP family protein required for cell wall assembly
VAAGRPDSNPSRRVDAPSLSSEPSVPPVYGADDLDLVAHPFRHHRRARRARSVTTATAAVQPTAAPAGVGRGFPASLGTDLIWSALLPGAGSTMDRHRSLAVLLLVSGVAAPIAALVWAATQSYASVRLMIDDRAFWAVVGVVAAAIAARFVAVSEVLSEGLRAQRLRGRSRRLRRRQRVRATLEATTAYLLVAILALPMAFGVVRASEARDFLDSVLVADRSPAPVYTAAPRPVVDVQPGRDAVGETAVAITDDRIYSVLLLGGDGAPGRFGNRTDSMMVVMVDQLSGRVGLVSVPRNLARMQFPPDSILAQRYPDGFGDLANAIYPVVERSAELSAAYGRDGLSAPALAVTEAVGYSLGITIDDYVFMDMGGFSDLIDAIGGVTMQLDRAYDIPPNVADPTRPVPPRIGPGEVSMDGPLAMGYARTRYTDSDVARMGRQRELLAAVIEQVSAYEAMVKLPEILESLSGVLSTSMDRERLMRLMDLIGGDVEITESVALARPVVNTATPDYGEVRWMVGTLRDALVG